MVTDSYQKGSNLGKPFQTPGARSQRPIPGRVSIRAAQGSAPALVGVCHMPAPGADEKEAARLIYVGATRASHRLIMGVGGDGRFGQRLAP